MTTRTRAGLAEDIFVMAMAKAISDATHQQVQLSSADMRNVANLSVRAAKVFTSKLNDLNSDLEEREN